MADTLTTNMPNGVTNAGAGQTMSQAGLLDPSWAHVYHNDFDTYAAGDWTVTKVGTGTAALAAAAGGQLLLTNTAGAADALYNQLTAASFQVSGGKDVFFKFRGVLSDVVNSVLYAGLIATTATPLVLGDGVYLSKPTGSGALQLNCVVGGTATVVPFPASCLLVNAVSFEIGFHVNSLGQVEGFFNPGTGPQSSNPDQTQHGRVALALPAALTTALLNVSFGLLNSTASARTLSVDYVTAVSNR